MILIEKIYGANNSIETVINEYREKGNVKFLISVDGKYQKVEMSNNILTITNNDKSTQELKLSTIEDILFYIFGYLKNNKVLKENINKSVIDSFIKYIEGEKLDITTMNINEIIDNIVILYKNDKDTLLKVIHSNLNQYKTYTKKILTIISNDGFKKELDIFIEVAKILNISQKEWNELLSEDLNMNKLTFEIINCYFTCELEKNLHISKSLFKYVITNYVNLGILDNKLPLFMDDTLVFIYDNYEIYDNIIIDIFINRNNIPESINILNTLNKSNITLDVKKTIITKGLLSISQSLILLKNKFLNKKDLFNLILENISNDDILNNLDTFLSIKEKLEYLEQSQAIDDKLLTIKDLKTEVLVNYFSLEKQIEYYINHKYKLSDIIAMYYNNTSAYKYLINTYDFNKKSSELFNIKNEQFILDVIKGNKIGLDNILNNIDLIITNVSNSFINDKNILDIINNNYSRVSQSLSDINMKIIVPILNDNNFITYITNLEDNDKISIFIEYFSTIENPTKIIKAMKLKSFKSLYYYKIANALHIPTVKIIGILASEYDKTGEIFIEFLLKANSTILLQFREFIEVIHIDKDIIYNNCVELYKLIITAYSQIEDNVDTILFFKPFNFLIDILGIYINDVKEEALRVNIVYDYTEELKIKVEEVNTINKNIQDKIIKEKETLFNKFFKSQEEREAIIEENKVEMFAELNKKKEKFLKEFAIMDERKVEVEGYIKNIQCQNEKLIEISKKIGEITNHIKGITNIKNKVIENNFTMLQENLLVFNTSLTTTSANNIITIKKMQLSMTTISKLVEKVVLLFNNKIDYLIFNKDIKKLGELSD